MKTISLPNPFGSLGGATRVRGHLLRVQTTLRTLLARLRMLLGSGIQRLTGRLTIYGDRMRRLPWSLTVQMAAIFATATVVAALVVWGVFEAFGTPQEVALRAEKQALQQQLAETEARMETVSARLTELSETDEQLYRTLLGAEPLSPDVRQAGVGGTNPYASFARFSPRTTSLLQHTSLQLDQLESQLNLQTASFQELSRLAEAHTAQLDQLPAILPTDGRIISGFGIRMHPILKVPKMHAGVDLLVREGTPVFATGDGVIDEAGVSPSFGKYVQINHPAANKMTRYAHLSKIAANLRPGQKVSRGEQIGLSGNTGRSSGPHLHYEVHDADGRALNPVQFFAPSMTPHEYQRLLEEAEQSSLSLD